jgi:hypothetical protein
MREPERKFTNSGRSERSASGSEKSSWNRRMFLRLAPLHA